MKFNKILTVVLAGVSVLSAQSCLKDQADVFDSSSSERLQAYIEQTREILTSNEKGWIMEYYPGSGQSKGGYAYYLAFTDAEVSKIEKNNSPFDPTFTLSWKNVIHYLIKGKQL